MKNKKVNTIFVLSKKNVSGIGHSDLFNPKFLATHIRKEKKNNLYTTISENVMLGFSYFF